MPREKPAGVIAQFGGQTPLNLAADLEKNGVKILGTSPSVIDLAEDRDLFRDMMEKLDIPMPESGMATTGGDDAGGVSGVDAGQLNVFHDRRHKGVGLTSELTGKPSPVPSLAEQEIPNYGVKEAVFIQFLHFFGRNACLADQVVGAACCHDGKAVLGKASCDFGHLRFILGVDNLAVIMAMAFTIKNMHSPMIKKSIIF